MNLPDRLRAIALAKRKSVDPSDMLDAIDIMDAADVIAFVINQMQKFNPMLSGESYYQIEKNSPLLRTNAKTAEEALFKCVKNLNENE